ncbi:uncharacterized protein [Watersipora subatra]|uniref:uncharacterized protein n=1 Tax=Watersipora subatra TaxID=2589382 RepID=UPI00355B132F
MGDKPNHKIDQNQLCETRRPAGCTDERPTDCADENIQLWLPQAIQGAQGACSRCYYCKSPTTVVEKEACPYSICPVISPLCNKVQPVIIVQGDRRCRGCSECVSYNNCPQQDCPERIAGCDVYGPNYQYINGELCPACRVCNRYKEVPSSFCGASQFTQRRPRSRSALSTLFGGRLVMFLLSPVLLSLSQVELGHLSFSPVGPSRLLATDQPRPVSTPLPCPEYNETACPLVDKCARYQDRYVSMGENRECQVCPECLEWKDPNENIPEYTIGMETAMCESATDCPSLGNCQIEMIYKRENGTTCRDCDRCRRQEVDIGSDVTTTEAPLQSCPDLTNCFSQEACDSEIVNRTVRIVTDQVCPWCTSCGNQETSCPVKRCPGYWCSRTAVFTQTFEGELCEVCVCTDSNQDCSALNCPPVTCEATTISTVVIGDHLCECPVCETAQRAEVDGGSDRALPDVRNNERSGFTERPSTAAAMSTEAVTTTAATTTTTTMPTTSVDPIPDCTTLVTGMVCPQIDCGLVSKDVITVDGTDCYNCQRCVTDVPSLNECPSLSCPAVQCGDSEDIAGGRRYRETASYTVNGQVCVGCEVCLNCPVADCPERLDPRCERYTRRTDSRGCVICPYCELWSSELAPPIYGRTGFLQSISTSECVTSHGNFSNSFPGLLTNTCTYNTPLSDQKQIWIFSSAGLMQDVSSDLCVSYYYSARPLIMRQCNVENLNMIWSLEKHNRFPQFFQIRHPRLDLCIDIGERLLDGSAAVALEPCEELVRIGERWSGQWWKFEEF